MKMELIPIIVGIFGTPKNLEERLGNWKLDGNRAQLKSARILSSGKSRRHAVTRILLLV